MTSEPATPIFRTFEKRIPGKISLLFAGDTLLGDAAARTISKIGHKGIMAKVADFAPLHSDVAIANLEAPVSPAEAGLPAADFGSGYKQYRYRQEPESLDALAASGFSIFNLGNNHSLDCGLEGLRDTLTAASARNLITYGAGLNEASARRGVIVEVDGVKVGLFGGYKWRMHYEVGLNWYAHGEMGGSAELVAHRFKEEVDVLRAAGADLVIATPHWGVDYKEKPNAKQKSLAKSLVEAGVDAIVAHGTHVFQPFKLVDGVPVFYSIGNFVFGTPGRPLFRCGLLPVLKIGRTEHGAQISEIEIHAIFNQNREVRFVPQISDPNNPIGFPSCLLPLQQSSDDLEMI